ncbi:MAG: hypothetical protein H7336_13800 [Bacteriovorax sp.]|nr:hypothetical protein [Bacteriovorax sp.]
MVKRVKRELRIDITEDEINKRIDQIEALDIDNDLRAFMLEAMDALISLDRIVGMKETTILRLRKIFNKKMEKSPPQTKVDDPHSPHPRGNNNGKNGKKDYPTAPRIFHNHDSLKAGAQCPECKKGSLSRYECQATITFGH